MRWRWLCVALGLAAVHARGSHDEDSSLLRSCWPRASFASDFGERCCASRRRVAAKCFDDVRTQEECCSGDEVLPAALARVAPDAAGADADSKVDGVLQKDFESRHKSSTITLRFSWRTSSNEVIFMSLKVFKRSAASARVQLSALPKELELLESSVGGGAPSAGDLFVHIGAGIGALAVAAALAYPQVRVIALEPAPQHYRYLLWNVRRNGVEDRVLPLNLALRAPGEPTQLPLRVSPVWPAAAPRCPLQGTEADSETACDFREYLAPAASLSTILHNLGARVRLLRLDCGGCEWRVAADPHFAATLRRMNVAAVATAVHFAGLQEVARLATVTAMPSVLKVLCGDGPTQRRWLRSLAVREPLAPPLPPALCLLDVQNGTGADVASSVVAGGELSELSSGGNIFLFTSFSTDDSSQRPLIPHFFEHYKHQLGLDPERFLVVLHFPSGNASAVARMSQQLRAAHGVRHTYPVYGAFTSDLVFEHKLRILHEHVTPADWVVDVDGDEFLFFPENRRAIDALERLDRAGMNALYGVMVDRVAASGDLQHKIALGGSLFAQYPLNCAITKLVQASDVRKAPAYRGYLRSTAASHSIIGLNASAAALTVRNERARLSQSRRLLLALHAFYGMPLLELLPVFATGLPEVQAADMFATLYHFKWTRGVAEKLRRRTEAGGEQWTQMHQSIYQHLWSFLDAGLGEGDVARLCQLREVAPSLAGPPRALSQRELLHLVAFNASAVDLARVANVFGDNFRAHEEILGEWLAPLVHGVLREQHPATGG